MEKFLQSLKQIQDEYDLTDEGAQEALKIFVRSRGKAYFDKLVGKYGIGLVQRSFEFIDTIPKIRWQDKSPEQWIFRYAVDNQKKLSAKELKLFFDKDGEPKKFVRNPFDDPINLDGIEAEDRDGETWVKEKPIQKPKPPQIRMPSEARLSKMNSNELGKLIQEAEEKGLQE